MRYIDIIVSSEMDFSSCKVGKQGEHEVTKVKLNCEALYKGYGPGVLTMLYTPPKSKQAFPVDIIESSEDSCVYEWIVKENVTNKCGLGYATLRWNLNNGGLVKTMPLPILVQPTYDYQVVEPPIQFDDWIERLEATIRQAEYDVDPIHIARLIEAYFEENPIDAYTKAQSDDMFNILESHIIDELKNYYTIEQINDIIAILKSQTNAKFLNYYTKEEINQQIQVLNESLEEITGQDIPDIKNEIVTLDSNKMEYFMVTIKSGHFEHEGEQLDYLDLKDKFDDPGIFLYLVYSNLILIPSIDVPNSALAFSTAWSRKDPYIGSLEEYEQPYIQRIIINSLNIIHYSQIMLETQENRINSYIDYQNLEEEFQQSCYPDIKVLKELEEDLRASIRNKANESAMNYSAIPVDCGKWIDGKTIKRRVYLVTSGIAKGNQIKVADKPSNMDMLIKGWGIVEGTDATKKVNTNSDITVYVNNDGVYAVNNFTGYASKLYVVIEYTVNE